MEYNVKVSVERTVDIAVRASGRREVKRLTKERMAADGEAILDNRGSYDWGTAGRARNSFSQLWSKKGEAGRALQVRSTWLSDQSQTRCGWASTLTGDASQYPSG